MSKRIEWIYCILVHCSLLYISQIPKKSPFHLKLFAWIICTEDVYFHRSVACSSTTKGVFFFKLPICLLDEQFKLEFTVYNYSLHMWLEKIFSTNHSCVMTQKVFICSKHLLCILFILFILVILVILVILFILFINSCQQRIS